MKTLFLDFDGVIHPEFCHESRHFCCLPMFEQVLRRCKDWDVVITSTWRLQRSFESLRAVFSGDVASRVLGVTPRFAELNDVPNSLLGYEREAECNAWLRENDRIVFPWLAIDDRSWLFRPFNSSVFLVDGKTGLTAEVAEELTERLLKL
ncbi:HAD domain-containing protein [Delftia tsuruhatensis]|uniref:HAD domain-containing protein n=1 Tax=Delftia tsuruhatensis TaxID=180282 RepID=UPI0028A1508F|nr:HAD domain-containing protein [Delftia tsuruhatensis]